MSLPYNVFDLLWYISVTWRFWHLRHVVLDISITLGQAILRYSTPSHTVLCDFVTLSHVTSSGIWSFMVWQLGKLTNRTVPLLGEDKLFSINILFSVRHCLFSFFIGSILRLVRGKLLGSQVWSLSITGFFVLDLMHTDELKTNPSQLNRGVCVVLRKKDYCGLWKYMLKLKFSFNEIFLGTNKKTLNRHFCNWHIQECL